MQKCQTNCQIALADENFGGKIEKTAKLRGINQTAVPKAATPELCPLSLEAVCFEAGKAHKFPLIFGSRTMTGIKGSAWALRHSGPWVWSGIALGPSGRDAGVPPGVAVDTHYVGLQRDAGV